MVRNSDRYTRRRVVALGATGLAVVTAGCEIPEGDGEDGGGDGGGDGEEGGMEGDGESGGEEGQLRPPAAAGG